jgi:hypothetical protein
VLHCLEQSRALMATHGCIPNRNSLQWLGPGTVEEVAPGTKAVLRAASTLDMGPL